MKQVSFLADGVHNFTNDSIQIIILKCLNAKRKKKTLRKHFIEIKIHFTILV